MDPLDTMASLQLAEIRSVLLTFAEECPAFRAYMLGRRAPSDAELVLWLTRRVERDVEFPGQLAESRL